MPGAIAWPGFAGFSGPYGGPSRARVSGRSLKAVELRPGIRYERRRPWKHETYIEGSEARGLAMAEQLEDRDSPKQLSNVHLNKQIGQLS